MAVIILQKRLNLFREFPQKIHLWEAFMKRSTLVVFISLLLFSQGCGTLKTTPIESNFNHSIEMVEDSEFGKLYLAPGFNFQEPAILVVLDPSVDRILEKNDIDPDEMKFFFKNKLIKELKATNVFSKVLGDKSDLSNSNKSDQRIYYLTSEFTELEPGSRGMRYLAGILGAGAVKVQIETAVKNLKTKDIYFMASSRRVASVGGFGGNSKGFIIDSLIDIAKAHGKFFTKITTEK